MKHKIQGIQNDKAIAVPARKDRPEQACDSKFDQAISEIQSRANDVGELLNGIIQAHTSSRPSVHHPR
jgi:hypothetical protein